MKCKFSISICFLLLVITSMAYGSGWSDNFDSGAQQNWGLLDLSAHDSYYGINHYSATAIGGRYELNIHPPSAPGSPPFPANPVPPSQYKPV